MRAAILAARVCANDLILLEIQALNQRIADLEKSNAKLKTRLQVWDKNERYESVCE